MQTTTTKLEESRTRLVQQGTLFVQQTSTAASTFFEKTKKAGEKFANDTRKAGDLLVLTATNASKSFATGLSAEGRMWLASIETQAKLPSLPRDLSAKDLPSAHAVEREVLVRIEKALDVVAHRLNDRLKLLDTLTGPQLPATTATSTTAATSKAPTKSAATKAPAAAAKSTGEPISGYDELSAKDVVAKLERLSDEKTAAVIAYENANKKRATVIRAAEQRLAEA